VEAIAGVPDECEITKHFGSSRQYGGKAANFFRIGIEKKIAVLNPTMRTPWINSHSQHQLRKLIVVRQETHQSERMKETMTASDECIRSDTTKYRDELTRPRLLKVATVAYRGCATRMNPLYYRRYGPKSQCQRASKESVNEEYDVAQVNARRGVNFIADCDEFAV
jgi:hypothetical protein